MDVFAEKIIRKKRTIKDYLILTSIIYFGIIAFVIFIQVPLIRVFILAILCICAYFAITKTNIEYEYTVLNSDIDIDKIVSKKKRSKLFCANCKDFEVMARMTHSKYNEVKNIEKKVLAVTSMKSDKIYFAVLQFEGQRTLLLFEPDEKMVEIFKMFNPRNVLE